MSTPSKEQPKDTVISDETEEILTKKRRLNENSTQAVEEIKQDTNGKTQQQTPKVPARKCPYLGTIRRHLLDFDFEKLCSVSLTNINVYACLVCGKYYQGRGKSTHAYFHSLEQNHHVFLNLHNQKVYCLPDNYEVEDNSLNDIKFNLKPRYTKEEVLKLDQNGVNSRALDGTEYIPGCIGLNNVKATDYVNVVIQALCRLKDLRNFFIFYDNDAETSDVMNNKTILTKRFAELIRKIWNPKNFKGHVSPHELLQAISLKSDKKFTIIEQKDPLQLMAWLFNELHSELQKTLKIKETVVTKSFQGEIEILKSDIIQDAKRDDRTVIYHSTTTKFMYLTLDIPPTPLYKDSVEKNTLPQVLLFDLLKKFDGMSYTENKEGNRIKYRIKKLPKYLVLHMKRFTHNSFYLEKNNTLVNFPVNNLDLKNYIYVDESNTTSTKYNLIANICHDGKPNAGIYKVYVRNKALDLWLEIQDLHVTPTMPQLVALSEAYIQIYERQDE